MNAVLFFMKGVLSGMKRINAAVPIIILCFLLSFSAVSRLWGAETTLKADALSYNPATKKMVATGNVRLVRADGELSGQRGEGDVGANHFLIEGSVRGSFPKEGISLESDILELTVSKDRKILEGRGHVRLLRGEDRLNADKLRWIVGEDSYRGTGNVTAQFETHSIDADEVGRDGDHFWGKTVRRYEDKKQRFTLKANRVNGTIQNQDVTELIAEGGLSMRVVGKKEKPLTITGKKGVYSKARGTLVVSGGARAVQDDRVVEAENLVLHLDSKRIEALGKPQITFTLQD